MRAELGKDPTRAPPSQLNLPPGFRFYPTDEELVVHYLCKRAASEPFSVPIIAEVELYKFDPWDLPERALFGEREWYFFSPRDRKYPNGSRPNRAAGTGYWKATGTDKPITTTGMGGGAKKVGVKKALVFYRGKAPKGVKTNWIMHEYRLADSGAKSAKRKGTLRLDDWVLCRIYKKSSSATQKSERSGGAAEDTPTPETDDYADAIEEEEHDVKPVIWGVTQKFGQQRMGGRVGAAPPTLQIPQSASSVELSHQPGMSAAPEGESEEESGAESGWQGGAMVGGGATHVAAAPAPAGLFGLDLGLPSPSSNFFLAGCGLLDHDPSSYYFSQFLDQRPTTY